MNTTVRFIKEFLANTARITIAEETSGDIWYEGDVMSLRRSLVAGTYVTGITLGMYHDIVITVKEVTS